MKNIKVYIAAHKTFDLPNKDGYIPLQVGAALHDDLGYLKDNNGENISEKNPNYCELTGLYYIWKNESADIVGLSHYRRYFFKNPFKVGLNNVLSIKEIDKLMDKYDIILPKKYDLELTTKEHYNKFHHLEDLLRCGEIIKKNYKEYYECFEHILNEKKIYTYNMFIMKKEKFDDYMKWLFDILFQLEREIDISNYDDYNKRIFGFLSERLFNVWIKKQKFKIKEINVYNIDEKLSLKQKIGDLI